MHDSSLPFSSIQLSFAARITKEARGNRSEWHGCKCAGSLKPRSTAINRNVDRVNCRLVSRLASVQPRGMTANSSIATIDQNPLSVT